MKIIEYESKYLEDVKDLLIELKKYIIPIDKDKLDTLHPDYREKKAIFDLEELKEDNGRCYLAIEDDKAIGLIIGFVTRYGKYTYLEYKCPKRGYISELIVSKNARGSKIGNKLIETMENYFKSINCEYVIIDVFTYNELGMNFYNKKGYHNRMHTMIKKL